MKRAFDTSRSEQVCRNALQHGQLVAHKTGHGIAWKFGRRLFSTATVARLIAAGAAIRDGDIVRAS
ncbi:MAG: hypothetical protein JWQ94_493 [Tardiphaga sp.]|nr:hypothetical protein [Tardiphaga sp.]